VSCGRWRDRSGGSTWWWCVFEAESGSLVDGGARAFLKLAQWDFNNFIPASTGVYENYGGGEPHGTEDDFGSFGSMPVTQGND
jgi:hypothetical protein